MVNMYSMVEWGGFQMPFKSRATLPGFQMLTLKIVSRQVTVRFSDVIGFRVFGIWMVIVF